MTNSLWTVPHPVIPWAQYSCCPLPTPTSRDRLTHGNSTSPLLESSGLIMMGTVSVCFYLFLWITFLMAAIMNEHKLGSGKQENVFSHDSGGQRSAVGLTELTSRCLLGWILLAGSKEGPTSSLFWVVEAAHIPHLVAPSSTSKAWASVSCPLRCPISFPLTPVLLSSSAFKGLSLLK